MAEMVNVRRPLGETYGGQAVIEGVLMRGKQRSAVAVRKLDGEIVVKEEAVSALYRGPLSRIPFLRGIPMLWDALGLGMRALFYSAEVVGQAEDPEFTMSGGAGMAMGAVSMLLGVGLFMVLPSFLAGLVVQEKALLFNLLEGVVRLSLLVGYIAVIGRAEDIRRVFAYHGAEHKVINAYEAGAPMTVEGVRPYSRQHARCGTAFLLTVVLISVIVMAPFGKPPLLIRIGSRLLLLPVIAWISYEILRFTAKHKDNRLVRLLIAPNLAMQGLTTREPDDTMIEVAIHALTTVIAGEYQLAEGLAEVSDGRSRAAEPA